MIFVTIYRYRLYPFISSAEIFIENLTDIEIPKDLLKHGFPNPIGGHIKGSQVLSEFLFDTWIS